MYLTTGYMIKDLSVLDARRAQERLKLVKMPGPDAGGGRLLKRNVDCTKLKLYHPMRPEQINSRIKK
jgi:hypothetical protein